MHRSEEDFDYLLWFWINADFGPSDGDVRYSMNRRFEKETGRKVPEEFQETDED
jgi:hypothetical protein